MRPPRGQSLLLRLQLLHLQMSSARPLWRRWAGVVGGGVRRFGLLFLHAVVRVLPWCLMSYLLFPLPQTRLSIASPQSCLPQHTHSCPIAQVCLFYMQGLIQRPALVAEFLSGCSLDSAIVRGADFLGSDLVLAKIALDAARVGGWVEGGGGWGGGGIRGVPKMF
jgi:hypothetical protein